LDLPNLRASLKTSRFTLAEPLFNAVPVVKYPRLSPSHLPNESVISKYCLGFLLRPFRSLCGEKCGMYHPANNALCNKSFIRKN